MADLAAELLHLVEVAILAAADEAFGEAFQLVPLAADFFGLFVGDGVIGGGLADGGEEFG